MASSVLPVLIVGQDRLPKIMQASPVLMRWLHRNKIKIQAVPWSGHLPHFPPDRHYLVYCSDNINGSMSEFSRRCTAGSHVLFYNDRLIDGNGRHGIPDLLDAVQWLINLRQRLYPS